ncbi:type II toxin-antitoxin system RelE/ParE family toxin [Pseudomonas asuensis]
MTTTYKVKYATTAQQSLLDQVDHLETHVGTAKAELKLNQVVKSSEARLEKNPRAYPVSQQAASLGVTRYREMLNDTYRVLYEVYESEKLVVVALIIGQTQSVESS